MSICRFIPTCSHALLEGLGKLAAEYDCHVTSHLSESYDVMMYCAQVGMRQIPGP